ARSASARCPSGVSPSPAGQRATATNAAPATGSHTHAFTPGRGAALRALAAAGAGASAAGSGKTERLILHLLLETSQAFSAQVRRRPAAGKEAAPRHGSMCG